MICCVVENGKSRPCQERGEADKTANPGENADRQADWQAEAEPWQFPVVLVYLTHHSAELWWGGSVTRTVLANIDNETFRATNLKAW